METHMNPLRNHSTLYHPNERELKTRFSRTIMKPPSSGERLSDSKTLIRAVGSGT
jgi:hypothetical protein